MHKNLKSNLNKLFIYFIANRRITQPVSALYFLSFPSNTVAQVGVFYAIGKIAGFLFELPSGYFSDKFGHKKTLILARILILAGTITFLIGGPLYIFAIGAILMSMGYAFTSGTLNAFIHETLLEAGEDKNFSKIIGKLKSKTLIVSFLILMTISYLFTINIRLPLLVATIMDILGLWSAIALIEPKKVHVDVEEIKKENFVSVMKSGWKLRVFPISLLIAVMGSFIMSIGILRAPYYEFVGINIAHIGFWYAGGQLLSALLYRYVYKIKEIFSAKKYFLFELVFFSINFCLLGLVNNKYLIAFIFSFATSIFWSMRSLTTHYQLEYIKNSKFKATLLSVNGLFESLFLVVFNFIIGYLVGLYSYKLGYLYFGIMSFVILSILYIIFLKFGQKDKKA